MACRGFPCLVQVTLATHILGVPVLYYPCPLTRMLLSSPLTLVLVLSLEKHGYAIYVVV